MKCPNCGREMMLKKQDVSKGAPGRSYDRVAYQCPNEDVWVTVETPQETS